MQEGGRERCPTQPTSFIQLFLSQSSIMAKKEGNWTKKSPAQLPLLKLINKGTINKSNYNKKAELLLIYNKRSEFTQHGWKTFLRHCKESYKEYAKSAKKMVASGCNLAMASLCSTTCSFASQLASLKTGVREGDSSVNGGADFSGYTRAKP